MDSSQPIDIRFLLEKEPEDTDIELQLASYDYTDMDIGILCPTKLFSTSNSKLICRNLTIASDKVTLSGIQICGSITIQKTTEDVLLENLRLYHGHLSTGGGVVLTEAKGVKMDRVSIESLERIPGVFLEMESSLEMVNSSISHARGFIHAALRCNLKIKDCRFNDSQTRGVYVLESDLEMTNTDLGKTQQPAIYGQCSKMVVTDCNVHETEQTGVSLAACKESRFIGNTVSKTKSSGICVSSEASLYAERNKFSEVAGNAFYVCDKSTATILHNTITECEYPAVAVLQKCTAQISFNDISKVAKTGICIRGAKSATLDQNQFAEVTECGVSISETENCVLTKNKFKNCGSGGVEVYNLSKAVLTDNSFEDCGDYAFIAFTGGFIHATKNRISNAKIAMAWLTVGGGGDFEENIPKNCPELYAGRTSGAFFMKDNGMFENMTNDQERGCEEVPYVEGQRETPSKGMCWKCHEVEIQGYCVPCSHKLYCKKCGQLAVEAQESCPLCRFPITSFTDGFNAGEDQCQICLEKPIDCIILPCGHVGYCQNCAYDWISRSNSCPTCRAENATIKRLLPEF